MTRRIAMLGAGSWGTALAILLAKSGHDVALWARRPEAAAAMRRTRRNPSYLSNARLPDSVFVTSDIREAVRARDIWVFATPAQAVRACALQVRDEARGDAAYVSVAKGIEIGSLQTTTSVLADVLRSVSPERIGVLSGPSHAEEVAEEKPTTVVAAAGSEATVGEIQSAFAAPRFRVYRNADLLGVEIAGSVKNVMALAAGIGDGLGYGDNTKSAIVTRGLAEIRRLGLALGAREGTFAGLAGLGDLVVTCMSRHSRNRYVGERIGQGARPEDIRKEMTMVAEGMSTADSVYRLARRHRVEMPITEAVYRILFEEMAPRDAVEELMARGLKEEA